MKRKLLSVLLLTFFVSFLSIGCDDDVKKKTNNNNVNPVCGNDILETGETCDGTDLGTLTCETIDGGFTGGTLTCTAGCALDTAGCTTGCTDACELDNRVCSTDTLRVCEANAETGCTEWIDTDCTLTSETCQVILAVAQCASCIDDCAINEERCNGTDDGIETCVLGTSGCTEWLNGGCPLPTPACELQVGIPTCVSTCTDDCTLDAKQCNLAADGIETCITAASGCTEWDNTACDVATPECQDLAGVATCAVPNGSGETCADPYTIVVPFWREGTDFAVEFPANDMTFTDASCTFSWAISGPDAVFSVDLLADEAVVVAQGGGLDGALFIQEVCDAAGVCLVKLDNQVEDGTEAFIFTPAADGTYFIIVKSYDAAPDPAAYFFAVYHYETGAELTCDDGFDNDNDGVIDCEDSDCFGVAGVCDIELTCGDGQDNDLDGDFDCADSDCVGVEPCGTEDTEARCGDGVDNDNDGLIDCEESACVSFTACQIGKTCALPLAITSFPFNITGTDFYTDYPVNNLFTYSAGGCTNTANGPDAVFSIDLLAGERITMPETGLFDAVVRVMSVCTSTTPTCLYSSDDPDTGYQFTAPAAGTYFIILEAYYATNTSTGYNFTVNKIPMNETNCTDGLDDDLDTFIDCNDADCFGLAGCTTELNCNDGLDNDDDGDADCDDIDCAAFIGCLGGDSCTDALPVTLPFNATGTDITADFTNAQTFTGTGCGSASGVEAVFTVAMVAGQRIKIDETGTLDAVIRVVSPCANATTCLLSSDTPETNLVFTAAADGTYHIVLEAWSATPSSRAYNFTIALVPTTETSCVDGIDNDLDTFRDCADSDCIGVGFCGPENTVAFCSDGLDNDGDATIDCFDANCVGIGACGPENTDALCSDGIDNDADGRTDCGDADCATFCTLVFSENFNVWPLTGWTIVDGGTATYTWTGLAAPALTGGTGLWAVVNSDAAPNGTQFLDDMITPVINLSGYTSVVLTFRHYYRHLGTSSGKVEISTDGGTTWNPTPIVTYAASSTNGAIANLNISAQAAGQANVKIRFRFTDTTWDYYWLIDDVAVLGN